jgi:hypothetical protein
LESFKIVKIFGNKTCYHLLAVEASQVNDADASCKVPYQDYVFHFSFLDEVDVLVKTLCLIS